MKFLVVDDHELIREALRGTLKQLDSDATVLEASDSATSMQRLEENADLDLILLDLNLPRKDGREVLAEIKQEESLRQIPVMILSTSTRAEDIAQAYHLHANCYIPKPVEMDRLVQLGEQLKSFWLCMVALPA